MCNTINIQIDLVPPKCIPKIWKEIEPFIQRCANESSDIEYAEDYFDILVSGFTGLFVVQIDRKLVGVTLIQRMTYVHVDICRVRAIAGDRISEWIEDINEAVYNWAVINDCQQVQAYGRVSWKKFYREQGWRMDKVVYTKPVIQNIH